MRRKILIKVLMIPIILVTLMTSSCRSEKYGMVKSLQPQVSSSDLKGMTCNDYVNEKVYHQGDSFKADNGFDVCLCTDTGEIRCTQAPEELKTLTTALQPCTFQGVTYNLGQQFYDEQKKQLCVCTINQKIACGDKAEIEKISKMIQQSYEEYKNNPGALTNIKEALSSTPGTTLEKNPKSVLPH